MQLKELLNVNSNFLFSHKNVHEQVVIFNQTLMNISSNYIPDKFITVDDKDPPWMSEYSNRNILNKKIACKSFNNNNKNYDAYLKLQTISTELSEMIFKRKNNHHHQLSDKLNDPETSTKAYWSILKTLYNGKKILLIPPILVNKKLISNFKEKANHFNDFFPSHCTPVSNDSALPNTTNSVSNVSLSSIQFDDQDILKIIRSLNYNKAHGYDDRSIRLLKICDSSIAKPLSIIFKNCLHTGTFPNNWKKSNVVPIHKKGDKERLQNYRPVSLLPACSKIFERIVFNPMLEFLEKNNLLCPHQSGFRSSGSCQSQLLSIVHGIYGNFDQSPTLEV